MPKKTATANIELKRIATEFIALGAVVDPEYIRAKSPRPGATVTRNAKGSLRVSYEFRPHEIRILETLSSVTGVSLDWFAGEAASWTSSYLSNLVAPWTGQLKDLIDVSAGGSCPVPPSRRETASQFVEAVRKEAGDRVIL